MRSVKGGEARAGGRLAEEALSRQQIGRSPLARGLVEFALRQQQACILGHHRMPISVAPPRCARPATHETGGVVAAPAFAGAGCSGNPASLLR